MQDLESRIFSGVDCVKIEHDHQNALLERNGNKKYNKVWYEVYYSYSTVDLDLAQIESLAPKHLW